MKKFITMILVAALCVSTFAGCGKEEGNSSSTSIEANTVATKLQVQFLDEAKAGKDAQAIVDALSENAEIVDLNIMSMPVEEGFLNGFDGEVSGFENGIVFSPMIGTIPFVAYVFETGDADALIETLKAKAMLNWNICTVADEMVVEKSGNLVFFAMAPFNFDNF